MGNFARVWCVLGLAVLTVSGERVLGQRIGRDDAVRPGFVRLPKIGPLRRETPEQRRRRDRARSYQIGRDLQLIGGLSKELGLTDEQKEAVQQLIERERAETNELRAKLQETSVQEEAARTELMHSLEVVRQEVDQEALGVLTAAQRKRVEQLRVQLALRGFDVLDALQSLGFSVDLREEEVAQFYETLEAADRRLEERLRNDAQKQVRAELAEIFGEEKVAELLGAPFTFGYARDYEHSSFRPKKVIVRGGQEREFDPDRDSPQGALYHGRDSKRAKQEKSGRNPRRDR